METWDLNQNENLELLYNFGLLRFFVKSWRSWLVHDLVGPFWIFFFFFKLINGYYSRWRYFIIITWNSLLIVLILSKLTFFCVFFKTHFYLCICSKLTMQTNDLLPYWPHDRMTPKTRDSTQNFIKNNSNTSSWLWCSSKF